MSDKVIIKVTKEEQKAIASLKKLAKKWPNSLALFSCSGTLNVVKNGEFELVRVIDHINIPNEGGDPDYALDAFEIEYE